MTPLGPVLNPLIWRELAAIGAIEAAVPRQPDPAYTFLLVESKLEKQANLTQLTTTLRRHREQPDVSTGLTGVVLKVQAALTQALDTTATLRAMRLVGRELMDHYVDALKQLEGDADRATRKALSRNIVQDTVLSAHIARRSGHAADERELHGSIGAYFVNPEPRVCMRCLLDRPGRLRALERTEPRPYQYICAACHDEVLQRFPDDLREQAARWPVAAREDRVIHRALSRPERLQAIDDVLYPLSGLQAEKRTPAAERAVDVPEALSTPTPCDEPEAVVEIQAEDDDTLEGRYIATLFAPERLREHW